MALSKVQLPLYCLQLTPTKVKLRGNCRQYSEQELHWRFGGACMHKTDGKLFCVAAPIPGAGAGGGEWGVEVHEMGGSTGQTKCSPSTMVRTRGKN